MSESATVILWWAAHAACCTAASACGPSTAAVVDAEAPLIDVVDRWRAEGRINRIQVERVLGMTLSREDANKAFAFHAADGVQLENAVVSADLREPVRGGGSTAGALLTLRTTRGCVGRRGVEAHYRPLTLTEAPQGHSRGDTTRLAREEPWGRLTFGFAEPSPGCVAAVTFAARAGRARDGYVLASGRV